MPSVDRETAANALRYIQRLQTLGAVVAAVVCGLLASRFGLLAALALTVAVGTAVGLAARWLIRRRFVCSQQRRELGDGEHLR